MESTEFSYRGLWDLKRELFFDDLNAARPESLGQDGNYNDGNRRERPEQKYVLYVNYSKSGRSMYHIS